MSKVTAYVISTAIVKMYRRCCACVQTKFFRSVSKHSDKYGNFPSGANCKLSKNSRRILQLSSGTGTLVLIDFQSQLIHVSFLNQKGRRRGSDVLVKMPP